MSTAEIKDKLTSIYVNLFNDESYTKQDAAVEIIEVVKLLRENEG